MTDDLPKNELLEPWNEAWRREQRRTRRAAPNPPEDSKTTAPPQIPGMTPREAARLGIWSDGGQPGIPRKFPYSIT
jgi:hypothetical protein